MGRSWRGGDTGRVSHRYLEGRHGRIFEQQSERVYVAHCRVHHSAAFSSRGKKHCNWSAGWRRFVESFYLGRQPLQEDGYDVLPAANSARYYSFTGNVWYPDRLYLVGWFSARCPALLNWTTPRRIG